MRILVYSKFGGVGQWLIATVACTLLAQIAYAQEAAVAGEAEEVFEDVIELDYGRTGRPLRRLRG